MYKGRGIGSKSEIGRIDRKRINDALDKHLERSSPSTSRGLNNSKDKDRISLLPTSSDKQLDQLDQRSASASKNKCSDGEIYCS